MPCWISCTKLRFFVSLQHGEDAGLSPRARPPSRHRSPATATRGSARSPQSQGRTCPLPPRPSHVSQAGVRPTQRLHDQPQAPSSNSSPKKLPHPTPLTEALPPGVPFFLGRPHATHKSPRHRAPGPTIKVPQLPRLRENVRKLSLDLRLHLQESLRHLQRQETPTLLNGASGEDGPEPVLGLTEEAQGTPELKEEVLARRSVR